MANARYLITVTLEHAGSSEKYTEETHSPPANELYLRIGSPALPLLYSVCMYIKIKIRREKTRGISNLLRIYSAARLQAISSNAIEPSSLFHFRGCAGVKGGGMGNEGVCSLFDFHLHRDKKGIENGRLRGNTRKAGS